MEKISEVSGYSESVGAMTVFYNVHRTQGEVTNINGRITKTVNDETVSGGNFDAGTDGRVSFYLTDGITKAEKKAVLSSIIDGIDTLLTEEED